MHSNFCDNFLALKKFIQQISNLSCVLLTFSLASDSRKEREERELYPGAEISRSSSEGGYVASVSKEATLEMSF